jgi:hypothetical protein
VKEKNPARHTKSALSILKLVLDRTESYEVGGNAELLIVAPFWPAIVRYRPHIFAFLIYFRARCTFTRMAIY